MSKVGRGREEMRTNRYLTGGQERWRPKTPIKIENYQRNEIEIQMHRYRYRFFYRVEGISNRSHEWNAYWMKWVWPGKQNPPRSRTRLIAMANSS